MNQHDWDALGMRVEKIARNMSDTACLVRVFAEVTDGTAGYHIQSVDYSTLAYIIVRYINRLQSDIFSLKSDVEFPPSTRHN